MRETRITLFSGLPLTISTATTTNGLTLDLKSGYVGDFFEHIPAESHGLSVELMFTTITSTNNNVVVKWQVSDDDSTWVDDVTVYSGELSVSKGTGTKVVIGTTFRQIRRYARLVVVTTGMSGSSFIMQAWVSDGVPTATYGKTYIRV